MGSLGFQPNLAQSWARYLYIYPLPARHNTFSQTQTQTYELYEAEYRSSNHKLVPRAANLRILVKIRGFRGAPRDSAHSNKSKPRKTDPCVIAKHAATFRTIAHKANKSKSKGTQTNATCKRNKRGRAQRRQLDPTLIKRSDTARARKTDQQTDTARAVKPTANRRARGPMQPASATKRACTAETSGRTSRVPLANNSNENTQTTVTV